LILVDANLLIYSYAEEMPQHPAANGWLNRQLNESPRVGLPWPSLLAFVRLVSNPKAFRQPVPMQTAWDQVESWLNLPSVWVPGPTSRHSEILGSLLCQPGMHPNQVPDCHLAALAIEHDLTVYSSDRDFERFQGVRWINPLVVERLSS
jgi:toxin-antitoxin system PIN domain toxin